MDALPLGQVFILVQLVIFGDGIRRHKTWRIDTKGRGPLEDSAQTRMKYSRKVFVAGYCGLDWETRDLNSRSAFVTASVIPRKSDNFPNL